MTPERFQQVDAIFRRMRVRDADDRARLLDEACGDDVELRSEVERLLRADGAPPQGTTQDLDGRAAPREPDDRRLPDRIGGYRIKSLLAEGGMGRVYLAVQDKPRRTVGLKVIRPGITSRSALRRFEYESQILARLRHPNIAQVYEAGTHDDGKGGVPFFAMEYVPNPSTLTKYAVEKKLGTRERIELFAKVCDAVDHGHRKGIIHRDLKPDNILVDTTGEPKIIDFGVARATDSDLAVTTLQTDVGQLIGTLQYMSPEQCAADPHDLDTRSDLYALGVVLYELLCERLPYDVQRQAIHEAARIVREQPPARPSTIDRALRGDLETITLKALEKDRSRRYRSVSDLADDLRRYLRNEPIEARPPSPIYRLSLFARRNPLQIVLGLVLIGIVVAAINLGVAAVLVLVTLLTGGTAVIWQMYRIAARQRGRAEQARVEAEAARSSESEQRAAAETARDQALRAMEQAEQQRDTAEAVTGYLAGMLSAARPEERGRDLTVVELVDDVADAVGREFADRPLVEARLRETIGNTLVALGELASADAHLVAALEIRRRELGGDHADTLTSEVDLGQLRWQQGRHAEAAATAADALVRTRRLLGLEHDLTQRVMQLSSNIATWQGRYDDARTMLTETLEVRRRTLGDDHLETIRTMGNLANVHVNAGRYAEAESLFRETIDIERRTIGLEHPDALITLHNLSRLLGRLGRYAEAEETLERVLDGRRRVLGEDHWFTLRTLAGLAQLHWSRGRYAEAEEQLTTAHAQHEKVLGADHPGTLQTLHDLATVKLERGRLEEAESMHRDVLSRRRSQFGETHPDTLRSMLGLSNVLSTRGRLEDADELQSETLRIRREVLGDAHPETLDSINNLAVIAEHRGQYDRAEGLCREALAGYDAVLGSEHPNTLNGRDTLGRVYQSTGRFAEAERLFRDVLDVQRRVLGPEHPRTLNSANMLATQIASLGRYAEAEQILVDTLEKLERVAGPSYSTTLWTSENFALLRRKQGRYAEAEEIARRTCETRRTVFGADQPWAIKSLSVLAMICEDRGKLDEADRLHQEALERRGRVRGPDHPETLESVHDLARLRSSQVRIDEAERLHREALSGRLRVLGPDHPDVLASMHSVAMAHFEQGRYAQADEACAEVLAARERVLGPDHPATLDTMLALGWVRATRDLDDGLAICERALEAHRTVLGAEHPDSVRAMNRIATIHGRQGRVEDAVAIFRETREVLRRVLGDDHPNAINTTNRLARWLAETDDDHALDEAETLAREAVERAHRVFGRDHERTHSFSSTVAALHHRRGRHEEAVAIFDALLEAARARDHRWPALASLETHARSPIALGRLVDAERLLGEAYQKAKERFDDSIVDPLAERVVPILVEVCETRGDKERAAQWRRRLAGDEP